MAEDKRNGRKISEKMHRVYARKNAHRMRKEKESRVPATSSSEGKWTGERREDPPSTSQREVFEEEFKNDVNKVKSLYNKNYKEVQELLTKKGQLKAIEKKKVSTFLFELTRTIDDNLPFLQKSFNEAMDKTVHEAKGEVEAFVMNKVTSLGIEGLEKEMLKLSGGEWKWLLIKRKKV